VGEHQPDLFSLPEPSPQRAFDGDTYDSSRDYERLKGQLGKVFDLMKDGNWRTIPQIVERTHGAPQAISARLRDFRKAKYGGHTVENKWVGKGLYAYRLLVSR
jgi:hypothetical protein